MRGAAWVFALAVSLWGPLAAGRSHASTLEPETIRATKLANGLAVIVCEDPASPVASVEVVVRAGSADDPIGQHGLAHLVEHACWAWVGEDDPRAAIEDVGGVTNAGTLRDYTHFSATVAADDLPVAIRALAAMVLREGFDGGAIAREQSVVLRESRARQDQPRAALNDLAFEAVFGSAHPYGGRIEGDELSIAALGPGQVTHFYRTWYVPNNMAVIVAGRADFDVVRAHVQASFGRRAPAAVPAHAGAIVDRPSPGGVRVAPTSHSDAYVMAAFVGPAADEQPEVCASDLLAILLCHESFGRLAKTLRSEQGLASQVGADFLTQRDRALFGVWAVCKPGDVEAVKQTIRQALAAAAAQPPSAQELKTAKRLLAAEYAFANETPADRAATLAFYEAVDTYRAASSYLPRVRAVTGEDVMRVAQWYSGEPVWVVLLPEARQP